MILHVKILPKEEYTFTRPTIKVTNLIITENGGSTYGTNVVNETVIDTFRLGPLVNDIKNTSQFKEVVKEIVKTYSLPKKHQNPQGTN